MNPNSLADRDVAIESPRRLSRNCMMDSEKQASLIAPLGIKAAPTPALNPRAQPIRPNGFTVSSKPLKATRPATADSITDTFVALSKKKSKSRSHSYLASMQRGNFTNKDSGVYAYGTAPLNPVEGNIAYAVEIQFGDIDPFEVIVDTGSSDTWLAQAGFQCVNYAGVPFPQEACEFGPLFNGTFGGGEIPDQNFNIGYGDGEFLTGTLGFENVTIAGITVEHQEVALVDYAYWFGDGVTSGLVGLAYPLLTSAYEGTDPANDTAEGNVEYSPLFTTMVSQNLVEPTFSLAIERGEAGGYIAFGGLPPVSFEQDFASTPIQLLQISDDPTTGLQYAFYLIYPDAFVYQGSTDKKRQAYSSRQNAANASLATIVDSGTTLAYLPNQVVEDVAALFNPPAVYLENEGGFFVACNATVPEFGVQIGGKVLYINPVDLVLQDQVDPDTGFCLTGIQPGGDEGSIFILGGVFLQSVVAVFDVGAAEMRFAAHEY
ncbi:MAG: hypothetical protein M1820_006041 [Bogoriella megaspora]|nr:MAG: hypothetical protein M1820_006041 [Bogoriella megaspora]